MNWGPGEEQGRKAAAAAVAGAGGPSAPWGEEDALPLLAPSTLAPPGSRTRGAAATRPPAPGASTSAEHHLHHHSTSARMFGRRGYDLKRVAAEGVQLDKQRPQVASDSDDAVEPINVERYAINSAEYSGKGSHESLRAAIAAGIREKKRKYDCRDSLKGWLSMHGLIIGKVLLFLFLLTATIVVTALSVRASQLRTEEEAEANWDSTLLAKGDDAVIAYTSCGPIQGWAEDGAYAFRGIPYALPPEGRLRWRLPVPLHRLEFCWNGTLVTHAQSSNSCWQTYRNGSLDGAEDCLTVDVFAPRTNRSGTKAPVVVLVAAETLAGGGGRGFDSPPLLSARLAARTGVLFVRVRFRLGVLGFLAASRPLSLDGGSGNYGLADVRLALQWVRANAVGFGGDPSSVTLLGHRAGASLALALAAAQRKPSRLFARAWLSGPAPFLPSSSSSSYDEGDEEEARRLAERRGDAFLEGLECSAEEEGEVVPPGGGGVNLTACLQGMDAEDLVESMPEDWKWRPVDLPGPPRREEGPHRWLTVDGRVLRRSPLDAWLTDGVKVPTVIGTTSHGESTAELLRRREWTSGDGGVEAYVGRSAVGAKGLAAEALRLYSGGSNRTVALLTAMITDIRSTCPLLAMARLASSGAAKKASSRALHFYVAESSPGEAGGAAAGPAAPLGPGADLLEILTHPVSRSQEEQYGSVARLFYAFVRSSPEEQEQLAAPPWLAKVPAMPFRVLLLGQDGRARTASLLPTCDFWERNGFVTPQFARAD